MKQPIPEAPEMPFFKQAKTYQKFAFLIAIIGSMLLFIGKAQQNSLTFIAVIIMFIGAFSSMVAISMSMQEKNAKEIVWNIILLLWLVLLPLMLLSSLSKKIEQQQEHSSYYQDKSK